jgi:hypothetical protein
MATQADYLVNHTVNDVNALIVALAQTVTVIDRIVQRARALGATTWDAYEFPEGYDATQAKALITALEALPESIVDNTVRNRLYKIVSIIQ